MILNRDDGKSTCAGGLGCYRCYQIHCWKIYL